MATQKQIKEWLPDAIKIFQTYIVSNRSISHSKLMEPGSIEPIGISNQEEVVLVYKYGHEKLNTL